MASIENITYTIIKLNKEIARMTVLYKTNELPEGLPIVLDLPINNGATVLGQDLDNFIINNAPIQQITDAEIGYAWIQNRKNEVASLDLSSIIVSPK